MAIHTIQEIYSLVLMDVIIALALLEMSLVLIIHASKLAELILIVILDFIAPKNHVMLQKVLAIQFPQVASISSPLQFVVVTTKLTLAHV